MRKGISMLLTLCLSASLLLTCAAGTYEKSQLNQADALNYLQLFLGGDKGYELESKLDRSQSVVLLLRMFGETAEAEKGACRHPFTDVPKWADKYVAYAYEKGYVKGYDAATFGGEDMVSDYQYLTMVLRALGYRDSGETPDFNYRKSAELASRLGLVSSAEDDTSFVRGNAVAIFWNALNTKLKDENKTLAARLIEQKAFTQAQFDTAADYAKNGKPSGGSSSGSSGSSGSGTGETKPGTLTWEEYSALSGEKQYEYFQSFSDPKDFFAWQEKAKADYEKTHPTIEVGKDGTIDLGDLIGNA